MRHLLVLGSTSAVVGLVVAAPVLAAGDEGGSTNPLAIVFDTAVWAVVIFVALLLILRKYAWGPILEGLQKRENTIRSSLEEAKLTRIAMEKLKADFDRELAEAHQKIPALMEEARKDAERLAAEMRVKAAADIQTERERLRREIDIARDQAIKQLYEQSAQLATLISAKAIGRALTDDDHRRLIDEALHEMTSSRN